MSLFTPFMDSVPLLQDAAARREHMETDVFLFFAGLLPEDALAPTRTTMQSLCQAIGGADKTGKKTGEAHWEGCPDWWCYDPLLRSAAMHR
jgi:hypothetical protein